MARVPEAELFRLKREVPVAELVRGAGVKLSAHGKDLIGLCPFHDDKEPSLVISPEKNLWNCLGACGEGGSVVDWVMKSSGMSFRQAVEVLRERVGVADSGEEAGVDVEAWQEVNGAELLSRVVNFYHSSLKQSPEALAYLEERGLRNSELMERFRLGFANRTLGQRLPSRKLRAGKVLRGKLQEVGILRGSGHEHFNGSLVVPIFDGPVDRGGRVVEVYGRKVAGSSRLRKGTPLHLYLPGPSGVPAGHPVNRGVWNVEALESSKEIILCESLIDALTFWAHGFRNVASAYGVNGFTAEMEEAFQGFGVERVLIAFDRDEAGEKGAKKVAARLMCKGVECYRVLFPKGMDANEYSLKVTPPEQSLGLALRKAAWMGKGSGPALANPEPQQGAAKERRASSLAASLVEVEPASPVPTPPVPAPAEVREHEVVIPLGDRLYRVRGLSRNLSYEVLKINLLASRGEAFHVDTLDLYAARQRAGFQKAAAIELAVSEEVVKKDLGKVLLKLEELQEAQIREALEPSEEVVEISVEDRKTAEELLKDPRFLERILEDFERCGVVGEEVNKLVGYLAATSRLLDRPLAIVVQSSSSAGKSSLMEAVLSLLPPEHQVKYSAMTGQSLFYMGETNLQHKILAIVEEEGAERASYALKLLQSEGELTIASTGKDPASGRLVTHEYRVEGPVMIFLTTTAIDIDEELLNRCLVLSVDEARSQTQAIHRLQRQRRTLEGLLAGREREAVVALHRNAQRLLRPLAVVNPYAPELTFLDTQIRTRRDHEKYLTLIDTIALLHQHQRQVKTAEAGGRRLEYIEVDLSDIETANRLAHEVLGRSLDELPPQTRRLLGKLDGMVSGECERLEMERSHYRFSRRQVRTSTGWTYDQVRVHLDRLVQLEYALVHQGGRGQSFVYELLYEGGGEEGRPLLPGLIEPSNLQKSTGTMESLGGVEEGLGGETAKFGVPFGPHLAPIGPPLGGGSNSSESSVYPRNQPQTPKNAHLEPKTPPSHRSARSAAPEAP